MNYSQFKAELAKNCERGKITKDTKKTFSHYPDTLDPGELIYSACSDLLVLFGGSAEKSVEYGCVSEAILALIAGAADGMRGFSRDIAVISAYIKLTQTANGGDVSQFVKLKKHAAEFNRSLQNVRYGLPLF